jgi:DNA-directed RNA polymerase subunit RPC12/RpoP
MKTKTTKTKMIKPTKEDICGDLPLPEELKFVENKIEKHYVFVSGNAKTCSKCGAKTENESTMCPYCFTDNRIIVKIRSNTDYNQYQKEIWTDKLEKHNGYIWWRSFITTFKIDKETLRGGISTIEVQRRVVYQGSNYVYATRGDCWYKGSYSDHDWVYVKKKRDICEFIPDDFNVWLSDTELKYTTIGRVIQENKHKWGLWPIWDSMVVASKYPWIELLAKSGMSKLYESVIYRQTEMDMRLCNAKAIKKYRQWIISNKASGQLLTKKIITDKNGFNLNADELKKLTNSNKDLVLMCQMAKKVNSNLPRFVEYIESQKYPIEYYRDYIEMAEQVGDKLSENKVRFPDSLIKAHDDTVAIYNAMKSKIDQEKWEQAIIPLQKYNYVGKELSAIVPKTAISLAEEGKALNHCVKQHIEKVLKNETVILFVRKNGELDKPLYTMEYRNGSVVQIRKFDNISAEAETLEFVKEWQKHLAKPKKLPKRKEVKNGITINNYV